jgi:hypothetical protein
MLQAAARIAKNVEAETRAYEIRMRAAKKANKIYDAGPKADGARGIGTSGVVSSDPTLKDLGISKQEMSEWRKLNSISDEQFEEGLANGTLPDMIAKPTPISGDALLFIGTMRDFERRGVKRTISDSLISSVFQLHRVLGGLRDEAGTREAMAFRIAVDRRQNVLWQGNINAHGFRGGGSHWHKNGDASTV